MRNVKLSTKLIGAFIVISLIGVIVGGIGITQMKRIDKSYSNLCDRYLLATIELSEANTAYEMANSGVKGMVLEVEPVGISMIAEDLKKNQMVLKEKLANFEKTIKSKETGEAFNQLKAKLDQYMPIADEIGKLGVESRKEEAYNIFISQADPLSKEIHAAFVKMMGDSVNQGKVRISENTGMVNGIIGVMMIVTLIGLVLSVVVAVLLTRSITQPINSVAAGLTEGADQVASASSQVASSSQSLAEGNSRQASSLEETSSSLEELSSMTKQTADNATQAKSMMNSARDIVAKVSHHMEEMTIAIQDITKSSEETGKIIKTIDEIAFQTNLLALNAAVEAARAGEAGAGFAVVADEVRNLAMRAAEAAKNTSELIEKTIQSVQNGNTLTVSTTEAFGENMEIANKIGLLIDEIAAAAQEQAHGITQINTAMASMDKVTQQAAANAEESASASEEMNAQAEQMKVFVQELLNVINGTGETNGLHRDDFKKHPVSHEKKKKVLMDFMKDKTGKELLLSTKEKRWKSKVVKPEEIIPFEEEKFKDF
ncbi:MAG: MCP four helix bundle domain-containing protein [Deltaproteobacteria bacterium]|nr:MCP four helix bundle domain-containing protein [Deltaproteobacteria bacterium]